MKLLLILGVMFALLLASLPVAFSLGSLGLGMLLSEGFSPLMAPQAILSTLDGFILLAVPLFLLMSNILLYGGCGRELYAAVQTWVGHWPGGLGIAMVISMGFFAAFCGSILAAITAVGTIMMPKMIEQGYPKPFVVVLAASAALLEALIPPSNAAILFSALTNVPVSQTFAAGIVPGLILLLFMIGVVLFKCRYIKSAEKSTTQEKLIAGRNAIPALITPGIILGGIYAGLLTPSESAAIAGVWAMVMGFIIYRELTISGLIACLKETASITAVIFAIIATATFLSVVLTYTQLPQRIITYFTELGAGIYIFWLALALICLILGTFIEIVPVFYLTVPIFAAIITSLNQNLLHLYVVFVAFAGIGMITPPVCVGVYTAAGVIKEDPAKAFKEVPLFVGVGIMYGILMVFLPSAATWLPNILR